MIDKIFHICLRISLILFPFSTSPDEGIIVVSYGLPILVISGLLGLGGFSYSNQIDSKLKVPFVLVFFYVVLILITTLFSSEIFKSLARSLVHLVCYFNFLYLVFRKKTKVITESEVVSVARWLVYSGVILSIYNIYTTGRAYFLHGPQIIFFGRVTGGELSLPWGATNVIASCLLIPMIICLWLINNKNIIKKKKLYVSILIIVLSIVATTSRNSIICLVIFFLLVSIRKRKIKNIVIFAILSLGFVTTIYFINGEIIELFLETKIENTDNIKEFGNRTELVNRIANYFLENPLKPIGFYNSITIFEHSSHNYFLTTLVEQGIVALIVSIILVIYLLKLTFNSIVLNTGVLVVFINLSFEDANFTQQYITYFWLFIAIIFLQFNFLSNEKK